MRWTRIVTVFTLLVTTIIIFPAVKDLYPFTSSYMLYVYNQDNRNNYTIKIKNEDSGWQDSKNIEPGECIIFQRIEPGNYSIRTFKGNTSIGDYANFEVKNGDWCIEISSVTGQIRTCDWYFCK